MNAAQNTVRIGTRGSALALRQVEQVDALLRTRWPGLTIHTKVYETSGDARLDVPLPQLPDNAFTDELDRALFVGEIDVAVHAYKDLPPAQPKGLMIAAVPVRADVREALVSRTGATLAQLPPNPVIGTSSERRSAQLRALRPDVVLKPLRGAVDARIAQVLRGDYDAAIFAAAGLERLGLLHHVAEFFSVDVMPPAAGQGALAIQCRADDAATIAILRAIDDPTLHATVIAERAAERVSERASERVTSSGTQRVA